MEPIWAEQARLSKAKRLKFAEKRGSIKELPTKVDAAIAPQPSQDKEFVKNDYFYIVLPEPEQIPNRIKMGITGNLEQRLNTYKTISPFVRLVYKNECCRAREKEVIKHLSSELTQIGKSESFICNHITNLCEKAKVLFNTVDNLSLSI